MKKITIQIKSEDIGSPRDLNRVALIPRKKGPHKDRRRELDKTKCRKKVKTNE